MLPHPVCLGRTTVLLILLATIPASLVLAHDHVGTSTGYEFGKNRPENRKLLRLFEEAEAARDRKDYGTMMKKAQEAVDGGSAWAKTLIAEAHMFGHGVPRDHQEALRLLTESAQEGDWLAQQHLAILYIRGIGIDHNYGMARYYLENLLASPGTGGKYDAFCRRELASLTALEATLPKPAPQPAVQPVAASQPVVSVPDKFPPGAQFRRNGAAFVTHEVVRRDPFNDHPYIVHERSPRGKGTYDVTEVKLSEAQLEDGSFQRVEDPTPFCTKCKGRGDSYLQKGNMDGYEYEATSSSSGRMVYVGMPDGTYKDCTQCQGTGFQ